MTQNKQQTATPQRAAVCRHHWLIDPPSGPTSHGQCRLCGAEREFSNFDDRLTWSEPPTSPAA
jgi:hypothetical protein